MATSIPNAGVTPDPKGATVSVYTQAQFDPRIYTIPFGADNGLLTRGYMKWDLAANVTGYGQYQAEVHFLFNPTTVTVSNSLDMTDQTAANMFSGASGETNMLSGMNQTVGFSLLFDRTFELWGQYNNEGLSVDATASTNPMDQPGVQGVNVDIRAFKQITGQLAMLTNTPVKATAPAAGTTASATGTPGGTSQTLPTDPVLQQGIMVPCWTWLYFGQQSSDFFFFGYIDSYTVTITHWSQYMVPMRCAIDVDFTLLPNPMAGQNPDKFVQPGTAGVANDLFWTAIAMSVAPGQQNQSPVPAGKGWTPPVSPTQLGLNNIAGVLGT